jgi:hypothetical protein
MTEKLLPNHEFPLQESRRSKFDGINDDDGATTTFNMAHLTQDPRVKKLIDGYEEQMR